MISFIKDQKKLLIFALISLVFSVSILAMGNATRFSVRNNRQVLSMLIYISDLKADRYQVMKVKDNDKIIVEIYKIINEYNFKLISRIDTGNKYEGYFLLGGNATNLAHINVDEDPADEIIVPGFDTNLSAHLSVIKFDSALRTFTLINQKIPVLGSSKF